MRAMLSFELGSIWPQPLLKTGQLAINPVLLLGTAASVMRRS
jgi:hypothetical protein